MALFASITTYPPLSEVTIIPPSRREFNFTVVLETSKSTPEVPWEVSIWYDHASYIGGKSQWQAIDLRRVSNGTSDLDIPRESNNNRYTFTGNLSSPFSSTEKVYKGRRIPFTVRYRINQDQEWQWVYHNHGILDGELILQPPLDPNFLSASPVDLQQGWTARKVPSEAPDAKLYLLDSTEYVQPAPEGQDAIPQGKVLGRVLQTMRWFALVRIWTPWLAPRHGKHQFHLSEPAVLLSFLRSDGQQVVLLAVNGVDDALTYFKSTEEGQILIETRNDSKEPKRFRALAASAWTFEVALSALIYEMRKGVRSSSAYQHLFSQMPKEIQIKAESVDSEPDTVLVSQEEQSHDDVAPSPQWMESWYDSLAYCTWNSLGQDLNLDKILKALDSFSKHKINISTLIIDDNWQTLSGKQGENPQFQRGWSDFEANKLGFPKGLAAATKTIRDKFPHIRDIAVWHALFGYWGGIDPDGTIAKKYNTRRVAVKAGGPHSGTTLTIDPSSVHQMYSDFYKFLSSSGITSVKTDAQFMLDEMSSTIDRRELTNSFLSAWTQAHLSHLSGKAISCMSCTPQILYHLFLPNTTPRVLLRNSDDFFPDIPESHPWHVFCNAHVSLFTQHLNVLPDWDMFQTSHAYSRFHATARCLSGGPIYITDAPGSHDVELISEMTARTPRGDTVILRPSCIGKTIGVYDKYDDRGVLKIGVYHNCSSADIGIGMLGVFNIAEKEMKVVLPITKIPGVVAEDESAKTPLQTPSSSRPGSRRGSRRGSHEEDEEEHFRRLDLEDAEKKFVVRSHVSGRVTRPIAPEVPLRSEMLLSCTLPVRGCDVWSAFAVKTVDVGSEMKEIEVAVLGLLGKISGGAAVIRSEVSVVEGGKRVKTHVSLKALGRLGVWVRRVDDEDAGEGKKKDEWKKEDLMVLIQDKPVPEEMVEIVHEGVEGEGRVIEVDTMGAWEKMGLDARWNNEVGVDILLR